MLLGLRTQEDQKSINAFKLAQESAQTNNSVFFFEAGDGHELITKNLWLEDMWGWLIPKEKADEFNELFINFDNALKEDNSPWWDYFLCAEWEKTKEGFQYKFINYPDPFLEE